VLRELVQGGLDQIEHLRGRCPPFRVGLRVSRYVYEHLIFTDILLNHLRVPTGFAAVSPEMIPGYLKNPGAELGIATKPVETAPHPKKHLLGGVEGLLLISG
jgi:hypothetical protein